MTYYEEDTSEIDVAENEGMLSAEERREQNIRAAAKMEGSFDERFGVGYRPEPTIEQTDPGENHTEMMEMLGGMFIQLSRIYDVLMLSLNDTDRASAELYHSQGKLLGDPPVLEKDAWS